MKKEITMRVLSIVALTLVFAIPAAFARTWTDNSGKFAIEAELVQLEDGKVQLRKPDGSLVTVPLAKLSDGDRRYLESREKAVPATTAPAAEPGKAAPEVSKNGPAAKKAKTQPPRVNPEAAIAAALNSPARMEFVATPLKDVIDYLKDLYHVEIQLDLAALKEAGVKPETPVTFNAGKKETLDSALNKLLASKSLGLTYVVWNEVILVTSSPKAESDQFMPTRVYKVLQATDDNRLIDQIKTQVEPKSWADNGGTGTISAWPRGAVVVSQTQKALRILERRYAGLLRRIDPREAKPNQRKGKAEGGIAAKLKQPVTLAFVETPLHDVVDYLSDLTKVKVQLDEKALKDAGVEESTPITISVKGVSLRSGLSLLTAGCQLTWVPTANGIEITSPSVAESKLTSVSYDVHDLLDARGGPQTLVNMITNTVQCKTWQENGGTGTIEAKNGGSVLQVSQHARAHEEVEQLLLALRLSAQP